MECECKCAAQYLYTQHINEFLEIQSKTEDFEYFEPLIYNGLETS